MTTRELNTLGPEESEAGINAAIASALIPANASAWVTVLHRVHNYVLQDRWQPATVEVGRLINIQKLGPRQNLKTNRKNR